MTDVDTQPESPDGELRSELKSLINRHSRENGSNTPDHVLADFLLGSLAAFDAAVVARDCWYDFKAEQRKGRSPVSSGETAIPDDAVRDAAVDAVLAVIDQIPGRAGDWMNVKFAAAAADAVLAVARRHIADDIDAAAKRIQATSGNWHDFFAGMDRAARVVRDGDT